MNDIRDGQDDCRPEGDLGPVKERVFLQLLIAAAGQTMAFRRVDRAAAGGALRLARKAHDPPGGDDRRDDQESTDNTQAGPASRYWELRDLSCIYQCTESVVTIWGATARSA